MKIVKSGPILVGMKNGVCPLTTFGQIYKEPSKVFFLRFSLKYGAKMTIFVCCQKCLSPKWGHFDVFFRA